MPTSMSWLDSITSTPVIVAGLVGISAALFVGRRPQVVEQAKEVGRATQAEGPKAKMAQTSASIMSPPAAVLNPPKSDPISLAKLAEFDGKDASKPIYVAIKGKVFDVSAKREMYGPGAGYNIFAGKDASKGLGMSSLKAEDAIADYSSLNEGQMQTLDQWEAFFTKRYNIVGQVSK